MGLNDSWHFVLWFAVCFSYKMSRTVYNSDKLDWNQLIFIELPQLADLLTEAK